MYTIQDFVLVYFDPEMSEASAASFSKALVALFGVVVMALTWVASLMGGILSAALALFGAIGGPLLGIFTLGLFVPFANSIGAICGILTGLFVSFWITVGAQMFKVIFILDRFTHLCIMVCPLVRMSFRNAQLKLERLSTCN